MFAAFEDELEKIAGPPRFIRNLAAKQRAMAGAGQVVPPAKYHYTQSLVDKINVPKGYRGISAEGNPRELAQRAREHLDTTAKYRRNMEDLNVRRGGKPNLGAAPISPELQEARILAANSRRRTIAPGAPIGYQGIDHPTRNLLNSQIKTRTAPRPAPTTLPTSFPGAVRTYVGK
jgi:hypothetical protein